MSGESVCGTTMARARAWPVFLFVLVMAAAALVGADAARSETCMAGMTDSGVQCGGGGEEPVPVPPPGDGGGGGGDWCGGVVVLYEHANFGGRCWGFDAGETTWIGEANDQASSIWVADGYVATIFLHAWLDGTSHNTATSSDAWSWWGVGDDAVSSLVVQRSDPEWTFYWGESETAPTDDRFLAWYPGSGCAKVGADVTHRNAYRRLWRLALVTRFCWNGLVITDVWERELAGTVDRLPFPFSLIQSWRYSTVAFQLGEPGRPSTVVRADGRFDFCGFRYGCITSHQPWVRIELHASGEAFCTTSTRTQPFRCERVDS